jgi:arylsulfatase A-like enzyme
VRILYIDIDSLRPDHLGCYGYDRNTSPNIDELASEGTRLTNYYASDVPCLPSRTGLFGGRFGIHTGVVNHGGRNADVRHRDEKRDFSTNDSYRTFTNALGDAGHRTAFISPFPQRHGAWHVVDGFDEWHDTGGNGSERAEVVYPYAEEWLTEHAGEEDWYLHVNFWDPHTNYDTPQEFGNPFEDDPAPAWLTDEIIQEHYEGYGPHSAHDVHHGYMTGDGPVDLERTPDEIADREDFKQWIDGYDVGVRYVDEYVGRIVDLLREEGVFEDTLVVLTADHGENQGELNVYGDHQTADEYTCNVPFIARGPGVEPGVDHEFHYQVDFAPTVTDLAGGDAAENWDGESFAATLTDGEPAGRDHLVLSQSAWACQRGVRFDEYLLLRTWHDGLKGFDAVELYDLDSDPHQTEDISEAEPELVRRGMAILESWTDARLQEAATDQAGGNAAHPSGVTDPLWEVLAEGGPFHTLGHVESYARRLRETGREEHAEYIEKHRGVVDQDTAAYLED